MAIYTPQSQRMLKGIMDNLVERGQGRGEGATQSSEVDPRNKANAGLDSYLDLVREGTASRQTGARCALFLDGLECFRGI